MKAIVIGGSNGIGLAIACQLIEKNYHVIILDRVEPEPGILPEDSYTYIYTDLLDLNEDVIGGLSQENDISFLMITAGLGRVAEFSDIHIAEIDKILTVNATSTIKILKLFYNRIKSRDRFYCGVMGSIAGWLSSPLFSVYAASKAAVCRFIESINIELEVAGTENRILNVSPSSIKGTRFNGGENQPELLQDLARTIIQHIMNADELYIPQYEETFKGVLERYHNDPHEYGLHSYEYKMSSDRKTGRGNIVTGYLSGTFDLFHVGHLNLLKRARSQCDYLIVGVHNNGKWKGKETFIPLEERKQIVRACRYVDKVVDSCREDCDAWDLWHYNKLFVGSDYKGTERFIRYEQFFENKGVEIVYFPYTKSTSSTQIRKTIVSKTDDTP